MIMVRLFNAEAVLRIALSALFLAVATHLPREGGSRRCQPV